MPGLHLIHGPTYEIPLKGFEKGHAYAKVYGYHDDTTQPSQCVVCGRLSYKYVSLTDVEDGAEYIVGLSCCRRLINKGYQEVNE